jgi:Lambda phage tail tube protein, TTP
MAASEADIGYGSKFAIESDNSPNVYTELAEIFNITPPSMTVDQIDVTHMQSPLRRREFVGGLIDPGECSFEMNYVPGSVSDVRLNELLDLPVGESRRRSCRITYPNAVTHTFDAELTGYEPTIPTDDKMSATVTFKVTGAVTRTSADSPPA